jgi:hypothetical protein
VSSGIQRRIVRWKTKKVSEEESPPFPESNKTSKIPVSKQVSSNVACNLILRWYVVRLIRSWKWRRYVHPKRQLTFNALYSVISQKIVLFKRICYGVC